MTEIKKVLLIHPEEARHKYNFKGIIENECLDLEYLSAVLKENGEDAYVMGELVESEEGVILC